MLRAAGVLPPAPTSPLPAAAADPTAGGEGGEWLRRVVDATNTELQTHTDGTQPQHSPLPLALSLALSLALLLAPALAPALTLALTLDPNP